MTSKRQKNKGFQLPEDIDGHELICVSLKIPNIREYRAAFLGHLYQLGKWWTWEKSYINDDTRAKQAGEYWRSLLETYLCISEAAGMVLRQSPTDDCLLEMQDCNGDWSTAFDFSKCRSIAKTMIDLNIDLATETNIANTIINRYDGSDITTINSYLTFENYNNAGDAAGNAALCMAVQSYVRGWSSTFARKARTTLGLTVIGAGLVAAGLGPIGWVVGGLVIAAAAEFTQAAIDAAEDVNAQNDVICCMTEALEDDPITQINWIGSLQGCGFTGGSNSEILRGLIEGDLYEEGNWVLFLDKLGDATPLAQVGVVDCPCDECTFTQDFEELPDGITWDEVSGTRSAVDGGHSWGIVGEYYTTSQPQYGRVARARIYTGCIISDVKFDFKFYHGSANNNIALGVYAYKNGAVVAQTYTTYQHSKNTWNERTFGIYANCDYIEVVAAFQNTLQNDNKYVWLDDVEVNLA